MPYNCGNPQCAIKTPAGKEFEGVIAYAMTTLSTVFELTAHHRVRFSQTASLTESNASAVRVAALTRFLELREKIETRPFDQSLLESSWTTLESAIEHFDPKERLLFMTSIRPAEPTLAEMAFCRVVDGWKFYMEELSGKKYGFHRHVLQGDEVIVDEILNEIRNLFVHCGGVIGLNKMKGKRHRDILNRQLSSFGNSSSCIIGLCHHALGIKDGDRMLLGMKETLNYLYEVSSLLESIEKRQK